MVVTRVKRVTPVLYCLTAVAFVNTHYVMPVQAQDPSSQFGRLRAVNMARMRAEAINGGLGQYRTASCMFEQGGGACLVFRNEQGFIFRFLGGPPGWQQTGKAPTVESEIQISPDGREVMQVIYNGPVR